MLLDSASTLNNEVHIGVVLDEHGQSLLVRIAARAKLHIISIFYGTIDGIINHGVFYMYMVLLMIGLMTLFYYMYTIVYVEEKCLFVVLFY